MKLKFNISTKLWIGFGILLTAIFVNGLLTYTTLVQTSKLNNEIHDVTNPSIVQLKDLKNVLNQSEKLISVWINTPTGDIPQKNQLSKLHNEDYPVLAKSLKQLMTNWTYQDVNIMDSLFTGIDSTLRFQHNIMIKYDEKEAYYEADSKQELALLNISYSSGDRYEQTNNLTYIVEKMITKQEDYSNTLDEKMQKSFNQLQKYIVASGFILIMFGIIIAFLITRSIVKPINSLKNLLLTMGEGKLPDVKLTKRNDEIGEINKALNNVVKGQKSISNFSKEIGEGDFDTNFKPLSEKDSLGNNLLLMRNNLKSVAEEDRKRNWTTGGLAKFSELLRISNDNVGKLSEELITELVRYLDANQGGIFVINNIEKDTPFLEMKGCYAWDRQKFIHQKIFSGDGLIGQCWLEQDTIYITDIPDDYVTITSGLGKALPKSILLVPMVANNQVFGVIEIASFNLFAPYEIQFIEQLAESTATTISSARVNERTKSLLKQTQHNSNQMRIQEEEMLLKQNEMNKTQDDLIKQITGLKKKITAETFKINNLKEENEVLQNIVLKYKKELDAK